MGFGFLVGFICGTIVGAAGLFLSIIFLFANAPAA